MPIMKTAPFVFCGETYRILDVVNSHGNSGRGTLAKWFMFCIVQTQHLGMCLSTHKLHVLYLLQQPVGLAVQSKCYMEDA